LPKVSAEHRENVRRRLLDAARAVVLREGPTGATTRAILDEARVSAGTLYNYFSSKEELFEALIEDELGANVAILGAIDEGMVAFVDELMSEPDNPALAWFRGRMSTDPELLRAVTRLNRYIVEVFAPMVAAEQRAGSLDDDLDPEALVELVDLVHEGMNRRHVLGTFVTSYERVGAALLSVMTGGAFNDGRNR
jgi:AcrR family transcriptional regulator